MQPHALALWIVSCTTGVLFYACVLEYFSLAFSRYWALPLGLCSILEFLFVQGGRHGSSFILLYVNVQLFPTPIVEEAVSLQCLFLWELAVFCFFVWFGVCARVHTCSRIHACMHVCMHMHMCAHGCEGQKLKLYVLCNYSLLCILRQSLSLEPGALGFI